VPFSQISVPHKNVLESQQSQFSAKENALQYGQFFHITPP